MSESQPTVVESPYLSIVEKAAPHNIGEGFSGLAQWCIAFFVFWAIRGDEQAMSEQAWWGVTAVITLLIVFAFRVVLVIARIGDTIDGPRRHLLISSVLGLSAMSVGLGYLSGSHRTQVPAPDLDLSASFFQKRLIRVSELIGASMVLRNKTFEDCTIQGPVVFLIGFQKTGEPPRLGVTFDHNDIADGTSKTFYIALAPEQMGGVGMVVLDGCTFRRCRLLNVGVAGPPDLIEKVRNERQDSPTSNLG
jgi:hypothetical protein